MWELQIHGYQEAFLKTNLLAYPCNSHSDFVTSHLCNSSQWAFFQSCSSYTSQLDLTGKQLKIAALKYNEKSVRVLMESGTN